METPTERAEFISDGSERSDLRGALEFLQGAAHPVWLRFHREWCPFDEAGAEDDAAAAPGVECDDDCTLLWQAMYTATSMLEEWP